MPAFLHTESCTFCDGYGYSPEARRMHEDWYGHGDFRPEDNGSEPFQYDHPKIWAFAEHNVSQAPEFYGTGTAAIAREARRLATLWNAEWSHHLNQEEVDAQLADGSISEFTHTWDRENGWVEKVPRLTPTAREYNEFFLCSFIGGPSQWTAMKTRAAREGVSLECSHCKGTGSIEKFKGQRKAAKKWKPLEPPKGKAWQIWETVSEGSPVTPAFDTPEELAAHWAKASSGTEYNNALAWIIGPGWAPSGMIVGGQIKTADDLISEGGL